MAIRYEHVEDHIVLITFDRPEAKNSADLEHFKQLREAWERFGAEPDAWVAVITGVGDAFFTGADLKRYIPEITRLRREAGPDATEVNGYRLDDGVKAVLRDVPLYKPVIAAVNGFCTAGGMEMLGGIDIRIACPEASFAVMEPKRGLFASGGTTVRLPRQIPWPQAMEFLLCADLIPAARALEMGLLNAVVPRDELLDTALAYARRITANAPLAVRATKQSALQGLYSEEMQVRQIRGAARALTALLRDVDPRDGESSRVALGAAAEVLTELADGLRSALENERDLSPAVFASEDAKEGPLAFAEKRPPRWQGR